MKKLLLWSSVAMLTLAPQLAFADGHESAELANKIEMANKAVMAAKKEVKKLKFSASKAKIKAIHARKAAEEAAEGSDEEKITMTKDMSMEADKASMEATTMVKEAEDVLFMASSSVEDLEGMMVSTHEIVAGDNLWNLAKTNYGDATMWPKIQEANEGVKAKSLQIGDSLTIPK